MHFLSMDKTLMSSHYLLIHTSNRISMSQLPAGELNPLDQLHTALAQLTNSLNKQTAQNQLLQESLNKKTAQNQLFQESLNQQTAQNQLLQESLN